MKTTLTLLLALTVLGTSGCLHQSLRPTPEGDGHSGLALWIDREAAPYVAEQLSTHPRFRGEPVLLVKLEGPDVQPEIDGLTSDLRDRVRDRLLSTPGVTLPWRPTRPERKHHRRLQDLDCRQRHQARYFIGIETAQTASGDFTVSVRAMDLDAREWVSGFGKTWRGRLSDTELSARAESRPDESLRGLRVLPFEPGEPDLAAEYLANNLSCLLRQQDAEELVLYARPLPAPPRPLETVMQLVDNQLSRFREVRVTDNELQANYILRGEAHEIQPGLYQLWLSLGPKPAGEHLAGMDTATYIRASVAVTPNPTIARTPRPAPQRPSLSLVSPGAETGKAGLCRAEDPDDWVPQHRDCPLLRVTADGAERLFVIAYSAAGRLSHWSAEECGNADKAAARGVGRTELLLPLDPGFRDSGGTVYAVATQGSEPTAHLARHLALLPAGCGWHSGRAPDDGDQLEAWLQGLDRIMAANVTRIAWNARRITAGEMK